VTTPGTAASQAAPPRQGAAPLLDLLGLVIAGAAVPLAWRLLLGLHGALGTDAALWGLSAEGLRHGAMPAVPPLFPALVAALRATGLPLIDAGTALALVAGGLVPVAVAWSARRLGAPRGAALLAGVGALALPDLCAWSNELSPNSAVALGLVGVTGLWGDSFRTVGRRTVGRRTTLAAVLLTALLPMLRETGVVVALAALPLLVFGRRAGWRLALAVLALWWLSPLLTGALPGPTPLSTPWGARGGMAVAGLAPGDGALPNYVAEIAPAERAHYIALLREGAVLRVAAWHLRRSLLLAPGGWLLATGAALSVAAGLKGRRWLLAGLLPLATVAPALALWTQRRHVLLAAPALLAVLAAATTAPAAAGTAAPLLRRSLLRRSLLRRSLLHRSLLRRSALLLALAGLVTSARHWPAVADEQRGASMRATALQELGDAVCAQADPRPALLLGGPIQDVGLYCPLPRHDPDGTAADALTALILPVRSGPGPLPPGWAPVGRRYADLQIFRLGQPAVQPCADAVPEPGTPYLSTAPVHARLVGCEPR